MPSFFFALGPFRWGIRWGIYRPLLRKPICFLLCSWIRFSCHVITSSALFFTTAFFFFPSLLSIVLSHGLQLQFFPGVHSLKIGFLFIEYDRPNLSMPPCLNSEITNQKAKLHPKKDWMPYLSKPLWNKQRKCHDWSATANRTQANINKKTPSQVQQQTAPKQISKRKHLSSSTANRTQAKIKKENTLSSKIENRTQANIKK